VAGWRTACFISLLCPRFMQIEPIYCEQRAIDPDSREEYEGRFPQFLRSCFHSFELYFPIHTREQMGPRENVDLHNLKVNSMARF
jgi:hypothetical protein